MLFYKTRKLAREVSRKLGKAVIDRGADSENRWGIQFL